MKLGRTQYQFTSIDMENNQLKLTLTCQNTQEILVLLNAEEAQELVNEVYFTVEEYRENRFRSNIPRLAYKD